MNPKGVPNGGAVYFPIDQPTFGSPEATNTMKHFSCDYCGKELQPQTDARYSLRMEARLVCESAPLDDDTLLEHEPLDPVDAMEDLLSETEDTFDETTPLHTPVAPLDRTYDLCAGCYGRIQADPLGLDRVRRFQFSDN